VLSFCPAKHFRREYFVDAELQINTRIAWVISLACRGLQKILYHTSASDSVGQHYPASGDHSADDISFVIILAQVGNRLFLQMLVPRRDRVPLGSVLLIKARCILP